MGIQGNLPAITQGPIDALRSNGSTMAGMGLTMEGQEPGNEVVYDALLDQAWSKDPMDILEYVKKRAERRYGVETLPPAVEQAWEILGSTIYNNSDPTTQVTIRSVIEMSPSLGLQQSLFIAFLGARFLILVLRYIEFHTALTQVSTLLAYPTIPTPRSSRFSISL